MFREIILNTGILADSSNPTFNISPPVTCHAFRVVSVAFIQNWPAVNESNNVIAFAEMGDAAPRMAKLPVGTYTSATVTYAIATALNTAGSQGYQATYDDVSRSLTVTTTGARQFKLLGANRGSTAYLQLGISGTAETGYGTSFQLPNPLNLSASQPILLTSRTLQAGGAIVYVSGINSDMNVLACISPDNYNDVITWTNPSERFFPTGQTTLSSIDLQLVDSATLRAVKTNAPLVVTLGILDDPIDLVSV